MSNFRISHLNNNLSSKINNSVNPYDQHNISSNNNILFNRSYNTQYDLGKENDNVNIYHPEDEEMLDIKEKELKKYRNEVDNIINNFKLKKDSNNVTSNSINNSKNDLLFNAKNKNNNLIDENIIYGPQNYAIKNKKVNKYNDNQNSSNQNERYSLNNNNIQNDNDNDDDENNIMDINSEEFGHGRKKKNNWV